MHDSQIQRTLTINLPKGQSAFLWGPRKTGKTTLLKWKFPKSIVYDFLKTDLFIEYSRRPSLLREELLARPVQELKYPVILDEVQKVPDILDEVHWLIENRKISFILCGSSARKLKRNHANMLGGRAWRFQLFPFTSNELKNFNLLRALNQGLIPGHYLQNPDEAHKSLKAYIYDYLKQEVFDEGLVRNIPAFSRFFDAIAFSHGELINYSNIARDCAVDYKTVREYFQILSDTLLGIMINPFSKRQNRQVITRAPKFYLFDTGVANFLMHRFIAEEKGEYFGKALEQLILMEIIAYNSYYEKDYPIHFWRTKSGLEVDFILGNGEIAIEIKGSRRVNTTETRALRSFDDEFLPRRAIIVTNEASRRISDKVEFIPWKLFLDDLWKEKIF